MDYFRSLLSSLILIILVTDGFPILLNDSFKNSTFNNNFTYAKSFSSNKNKIHLTTIYLFVIVWIILIILGLIFYFFLYFIYIPKLNSITKKTLYNSKRKRKLFYNQINQRYHKQKNKTGRLNIKSEDIFYKNFESFKNLPQSLNIFYQSSLNKNESNRRNDCSEEKSKGGGCNCCGKSKKSDSQTSESKSNVHLYRSKQQQWTEPNSNQRPHNPRPYNPKPYEPPSFPNRLPPTTVSEQHMISSLETVNINPLEIKPEHESMLHNPQQSVLQNPRTPTPIMAPPPPPMPPYSQKNTRYTQKTVTTTHGQNYGGSTTCSGEDEKTVKNSGCCAPKKKSSGAIHAKVQGYKVEGHIRVKGKNNQQTISIPEDTYMLTR